MALFSPILHTDLFLVETQINIQSNDRHRRQFSRMATAGYDIWHSNF